MKSIIVRSISGLLAFLMCIATLIGLGTTKALAAPETSVAVMIAFPRDGDVNQEYGEDTWGHPPLKLMNGWNANSNDRYMVYAQGDFDSQVCYCIEPGVQRYIDDWYTSYGEDFWDNYPSSYNHTIEPDTIKLLIGRIMQYGFQGNISTGWRSQTDADKFAHNMATQILVWETVVGERDEIFNHVDTGGKDPVKSFIAQGNPMYNQFCTYYDSMVASVKGHTVIPSFMARSSGKADTVNLAWNGSEYTATLTDNNSVLSKFTFSSDMAGLNFTVNGNKLTLSSANAPSGTVSITAEKTQNRAGILTWSDGIIDPNNGVQDVVTYTASVSDPVKAFLKAEASFGELQIVKNSEDGNVSGVTFTVEGNGIRETVTTGKDGKAALNNLQPGTYTVTEAASDLYEPQSAKTITIESGKTATVSFNNMLRRGNLKIIKKSEDGKVSGISFRVTGNGVDQTVKTNSNGEIDVQGLLPGTYTVTESTPETYVVQKAQTVTVKYGETATATFTNVLKRGDLKIVKTSEDGKVSGIKFRVTGNRVDQTVQTDKNGEITIQGLLPGTYTVTEETIDAYEPQKAQTAAVKYGETVSVTFRNTLKKGGLQITKSAEDGMVEGIRFHLFGKALNGSTVDKYAVTDSKGIAVFENIPIGTGYAVKEVETGEAYIIPEEQNTPIKWNEVVKLSFDNRLKRGDLEISKTSEDGLVEGVKFRLYGTAANGDAVDLYATTNAQGIASFKNVMIGSRYTVEEIDTAERYIIPANQTTAIEWNKVAKLEFDNILKRGSLQVSKTSEDGLVEGVEFRLCGTSLSGDAIDITAKTDSKGIAVFSDILIGSDYTIEELNTKAWYIVPEAQKAAIEWAKVTRLSFENTLKRGDLQVTKSSEDGLTEGVKFHLYGTSDSGIAVDEYAETDETGTAVFSGILIGDGYTIEEVDTAIRYVVPENQTGDIEWDSATHKSFTNTLKKFQVTLTKTDSETGAPQGDAFLAGAVYGLYKGEELVSSYTTDENGQFTTEYYPCGDDWSIREITPSEGYLLDGEIHHVGAESDLYTIELNTISMDVTEDMIKGRISVIKHCDNGETGMDTPETGAEFEVYLKSAGSYEDAADSVRVLLVCDEYGYAESKDLPYGIYTVHQKSGWDGRELISDFDVYVSNDGQIYRFLMNDAVFESYIKVVKRDSETGKTIPYAGAGFQIYDPNGELVTMTFTYPELTVIDTFYTTSDGTLITPEKLVYGKGYSLVEVQAPYGYVLDSTPIIFDIAQEHTAAKSEIMLIVVEKINAPQKGTISIIKTGEVFASVTRNGERYEPVYEIRGLAGAVYEISAAEDIVTPDGTVRYESGTIVDTITTDETGFAKSRELYLGKYEIREIEAPYGMVLNQEAQTAELKYAGQEIEITETSASFRNERQNAAISLMKILEKDELFGVGESGEIQSVRFGLYAAKAMTAADGSEIPENGLVAIAACDENGRAVFECDVPMDSEFYVKEISTDTHYVLSDTRYPVTFQYTGENTSTVKIKVNDGKTILNELVRGTVRGLKVDEDENTISGAVFGLFHPEETVFDVDHALMTSTTNENGIFSFQNLVYGEYVVREITAAEGFILNESAYPVTIREDNELVEIGFENLHITGAVELTKVDEDYPENKLTGAEFEIWLDLDDSGAFDADKDVFVGMMEEIEPGIYRMEGLRFGRYFAYEKSAPEGFQKDDGYYFFEIREDGKTVVVENEAGVGFINKAQTGSIRIKKTSEDGVLEGFTFKVEGTDICGNPYFQEFMTDKNGQILIEGLRIGTYKVSEVSNEASERYILPENAELIVRDGETTIAEFYNEIPEIPEIPQTGDETNILLWEVMAALSLAGIAVAAFMIFRKKKNGGDSNEH